MIYITQLPLTGGAANPRPKFPNLVPESPVYQGLERRYGGIKVLLRPNDKPNKTTIAQLKSGLSSFSNGDYLLLVGSPLLIGLASIYAADRAETLNYLQWQPRGTQETNWCPCYVEVSCRLD